MTFTCLNKEFSMKREKQCKKKNCSLLWHGEILTAGSFTIDTEVPILWFLSPACFFPHLVDLRHAQFGIQAEEEASIQNCQAVLVPVPQVLQVLVVDGGECIYADNGGKRRDSYKYLTELTKTTLNFHIQIGLTPPPGGSAAERRETHHLRLVCLTACVRRKI